MPGVSAARPYMFCPVRGVVWSVSFEMIEPVVAVTRSTEAAAAATSTFVETDPTFNSGVRVRISAI